MSTNNPGNTGKKFQKCKEDFVCDKCGTKITGSGYTNHCSECLWSKHVDINPGDRSSNCGGMMEPVLIEKKRDDYVLLHKCQKCDFERKNKIGEKDDFDAILKISSKNT